MNHALAGSASQAALHRQAPGKNPAGRITYWKDSYFMSLTVPNETALKLLSGFARALVHQVRGPLSVVSNDLFYFQSTAVGEDFSRPLAQCREINRILQQAAVIGSEPLKFDYVPLLSLVKEVFDDGRDRGSIAFECGADLLKEKPLVYGEAARLRLALSWLKELMAAGRAEHSALKMYLARSPFGFELRLLKSGGFFGEGSYNGDSLVDFFNRCLGSDSIYPALAEAVFIGHGVGIRIQARDGLKVVLLFPVKNRPAVDSFEGAV